MINFIKACDNNTDITVTPYVLIDSSGSTSSKSNIYNNCKNVLQSEFRTAYEILLEKNISECNLIVWNDEIILDEHIEVDKLLDKSIKPSGGTYLYGPLQRVLDNMKKNDSHDRDIYIFTDGEVCDGSELGDILSELFSRKANIYIVAVENNNNNYLENECYAGNALIRYIGEQSKMNFVKKVILYNNNHKTGFTSLHNFSVPDNYLPFRDNLFHVNQFSEFLNYLKEVLKTEANENALLKLAHDVSRTLFYYSKDKESFKRRIILDYVCDCFKNTNIYKKIRGMLLKEIDNHVNNRSTTFQQYKSMRNEMHEKSRFSLMENVAESVTDIQCTYISLPMKTNRGVDVFTVNYDKVIYPLKIGKNIYNNSCAKINGILVPLIPTKISSDIDKECLRQWIKIVYSHMHNLHTSSNKIIYHILVDFLQLCLSKSSMIVIEGYKNIIDVMLSETIYGETDKTIFDSLTMGNPLQYFEYLEQIKNMYDFLKDSQGGNIWYNILLNYGNKELHDAQKLLCGNDVRELDRSNMIGHIDVSHKYESPQHIAFDDFVCTGIHIKEENGAYDCDLCGKSFLKEQLILNKNYCEEIESIVIDDHDGKFRELAVEDIILEYTYNEENLFDMNDLDFSLPNNHKIKNVMINDILNNSKLVVHSSEEFTEIVHNKYPFMKGLNMDNVVLAGGFARSILLGQKLKDFDFFFYDVEDNVPRMIKLMNELVNNIKLTDPDSGKCKFLFMFKPLFNVFEMVYIEDPTNHFTDDFTIDNFPKYSYDSLKLFDKKNNMEHDKYYFEDFDDKGIKMKYRFQFIMINYRSIAEILNSFDLSPSQVAFNGSRVYFTRNSHLSYKYMVNIIASNKWSFTYDQRVSKYFSYGFDMVFPISDIANIEMFGEKFGEDGEEHKLGDTLQLCTLQFDILKVLENQVYIKHDSHKKELLASINDVEKKCIEEGKSCLYRSTLFCSLVSLIRYMAINNIHYKFSTDSIFNGTDSIVQFKDEVQNLVFIDGRDLSQPNMWYVNHLYTPPKENPPYDGNNNEQGGEEREEEDGEQ